MSRQHQIGIALAAIAIGFAAWLSWRPSRKLHEMPVRFIGLWERVVEDRGDRELVSIRFHKNEVMFRRKFEDGEDRTTTRRIEHIKLVGSEEVGDLYVTCTVERLHLRFGKAQKFQATDVVYDPAEEIDVEFGLGEYVQSVMRQ